jgi:hypothetical protein
MVDMPILELVRERKISELVSSDKKGERWEASGVMVKDGHYFVAFDDRSEIARISSDLQRHRSNGLLGMMHHDFGYEGITYNTERRRYYLLVESRRQSRGCYKALIVEYDEDFKYRKERSLDFTFKSDNKGFEAVAYLRRRDKDYLLALCEGNLCRCGEKGRTPGGGRVQVFEKNKKCWQHSGSIALPASLPFVDYSGMSISDDRIAVVSQESSLLWIGRFDDNSWTCRDTGRLYQFPRDEDGAIRYGNIEGVAWTTPTRVVTVSDRRKKKSQPEKLLSEKDQSIHVFEIPS